jgi:hypothetical protein
MAFAQQIHIVEQLQWEQPRKEYRGAEEWIEYLHFTEAYLLETDPRMPFYEKTIPVEAEQSVVNLRIVNQQWQNLTGEELRLIRTEEISDSLQTSFSLGQTRKQAELSVRFLPFRRQGGSYQKLLSFSLQGNVVPLPTTGRKEHKAHVYAASSILSRGDFYKMGISQTGIYKITHNDLKTMKADVNSLPINDIAVFGNGGNRLAESTSVPVFDDLQEVPIWVSDHNGNGIFDEDDYILFYAVGIISWMPKNIHPMCQFEHEMNFYTRQTYYFLTTTAGVGAKKRISSISSVSSAPTHTVTTYYYRGVVENEKENIAKTSRIWMGENMSQTNPVEYRLRAAGIDKTKPIFVRLATAANNASSFAVTLGGDNRTFTASNTKNNYRISDYPYFYHSSDELVFTIKHTALTAGATGWLDYLEVHATAALGQYANQIHFRNPEIAASGNVADYQFNTQGKNTTIWDVTDRFNVKKVNGVLNGNTLLFRLSCDTLREFAAFDGSSFLGITPVGKINNQNLHSLGYADLIIVTHSDFLQQAERLAAFRRQNDGMIVHVVTVEQVYNEFSSGAMDASAIRNFLKMFYDRAATADDVPKNCLLFGKASVDFRNLYGTHTCFIPLYQGTHLFDMENDMATDNYFGKLADGKGLGGAGRMDMGIGRLSAKTAGMASALVDKSIRYAAMNSLVSANDGQISNMADWRNVTTFVADDDANPYPVENHFGSAEQVIHRSGIDTLKYVNIDKIYSDTYKKVSSSQGDRYPDVNAAIQRRVNKGCLLLAYFGHGGDGGWSQERILLRSDIQKWNNRYCLPFFFTGCCTFNYYDRLDGTSPAEDALFRTEGGAIGLITSTRNTTSSGNESLSTHIFKYAFAKNTQGKYLTLGEIHALSQAQYTYDSQILMGDPSITPAHPHLSILTDSINGNPVSAAMDTIKSLQRITVNGHIEDGTGNLAANFNGWVYPSFFDKMDTINSLMNNTTSTPKKCASQKNILYKGKIRVTNGRFNYSFITPKDMNVSCGQGKISYYGANLTDEDAKGYTDVMTGGIHDTVINDDIGPDIRLWLNDEKFVNGGITTPTPVLIAQISDSSGVNTSGIGVGHEILAVIDGDVSHAIVLNDFFEYDSNSSISGRISYALPTLSTGRHTLTLRAWDIVNNMGENSIDFEVVESSGLKLDHVLNYPNPFTTRTQFFFEHNRPNTSLTASVQIFTISCKVVRSIISHQTPTGFRSDPIFWDGKDDFGDKLARGVYVYKLKVVANDGSHAEKIEKIVIL